MGTLLQRGNTDQIKIIPAKAEIQERTLRRNTLPILGLPPFEREKTNWIPAFAQCH
jgi:hypothetical protein